MPPFGIELKAGSWPQADGDALHETGATHGNEGEVRFVTERSLSRRPVHLIGSSSLVRSC